MKKYRDHGAFGALIDEYEKTVIELQQLIVEVTSEELVALADASTKDPDCKSIQTVLSHVVRAGYGYVVEIRRSIGEDVAFKEGELLNSVEEYHLALNEMFQYNAQLLEDHSSLQLEEYKNENKIAVRWGQKYDVEQLLEHAIVHVLRHRRQIEKFLIFLRS
jgi:uncharacterized damage-inducible protein DinB